MQMTTADASEYQELVQFLYRTPVGLVDMDAQGRIHLMTPMAAQLLMPLCGGRALTNLFDALDDALPQLRSLVASSPLHKGAICEALRFGGQAPGATRGMVLSLSLFRSEGGRLTAVLHDASREERRHQRRLEAAAHTDSLTGLPSRQTVHDHLGECLAHPTDADRVLTVLFLNCDRFQHINDTAGHAAGDAVLGQVAARLLDAMEATPLQAADTMPAPLEPARRVPHAMVGRVGGDEFAIVVELERAPHAAEALAARIATALSRPYMLDGRPMQCPVSIGIAFAQPGRETPGRSLYNARLAMAEAKRAGGNRTRLFDDLMLDRTRRRTSLENDLRKAIGTAQLYVVYQPVVRLQDHALDAVEALVRWRHPVHGALSPVEFIGIAEDSGLIGALGHFVLATACHQFAQWQRRYGTRAPRVLAVNLSRGQLPQPSLAADIQELLRETGLPASALQLEVTESLAAQDEVVQMRLHELKRLGLTLALDDFGTGYSSLASLYQLPVDTLKIDRSFVSQLETSAHHRVLAEATIKVAQSLNFRTVAEGIETQGQADILTAMNCDKGQGYLFARPMEPVPFESWLNDPVRSAGVR